MGRGEAVTVGGAGRIPIGVVGLNFGRHMLNELGRPSLRVLCNHRGVRLRRDLCRLRDEVVFDASKHSAP